MNEVPATRRRNPTKYMDRPLSTWRRDIEAYVRKLEAANKRIAELEAELSAERENGVILTRGFRTRAEKAEAEVGRLRAELLQERKDWVIEHETRAR